jgi:hypothetical protein
MITTVMLNVYIRDAAHMYPTSSCMTPQNIKNCIQNRNGFNIRLFCCVKSEIEDLWGKKRIIPKMAKIFLLVVKVAKY